MEPVSGGALKRTYRAHETARMDELDGLELASFQARAIAFVIDFLLAAVVFVAIGALIILVMVKLFHFNQGSDRHVKVELDFFHNWYSVVYLVAFFGLSHYLGNGQTIGKRMMGIRVVSLVHHKLSLWHAIERSLGYGASALELGFGFAQFFIERNRRTVHDRIGETIVVREPKRSPA
jgi:uncharacterized RDD family membrane protein YckC